MWKSVILIVSSFSCVGCSFLIGKDDTLTFSKEEYLFNNLKLTGYYYTGEFGDDGVLNVYFFYRNGVILNTGSFPSKQLEERAARFNSTDLVAKREKTKFSWGLFRASEDSIFF